MEELSDVGESTDCTRLCSHVIFHSHSPSSRRLHCGFNDGGKNLKILQPIAQIIREVLKKNLKHWDRYLVCKLHISVRELHILNNFQHLLRPWMRESAGKFFSTSTVKLGSSERDLALLTPLENIPSMVQWLILDALSSCLNVSLLSRVILTLSPLPSHNKQ